MSNSIEALAMAGVDYNEWGMDFEEWERMEMGPPPPHLYADAYEEHEHEKDDRDEEVVMPTSSANELCGFTTAKNHSENVINERNKDDDDSRMQSSKLFNFVKCNHIMNEFKMLLEVIMVIVHEKRECTSGSF
ncbi:hypothetical protein L1887_07845 [Cichorium endivia]|nr:hypothetical protein L1887_07845 [Cichorium endivia]